MLFIYINGNGNGNSAVKLYKPVVVLAAAKMPPMASFPNADVDAASSDSSGKMLCHIRRRACAVCSHRSDAGDCAVEGHVWQQILYHNLYRNVFSVSAAVLLQRHFDGLYIQDKHRLFQSYL